MTEAETGTNMEESSHIHHNGGRNGDHSQRNLLIYSMMEEFSYTA